jgi:hypothetical protein
MPVVSNDGTGDDATKPEAPVLGTGRRIQTTVPIGRRSSIPVLRRWMDVGQNGRPKGPQM